MIYTTYFAQLRNLPPNVITISICRFPPKWFSGLEYLRLAPSWKILKKWKDSSKDYAAANDYVRQFNHEVLELLSAREVLCELQALVPGEIQTKMKVSISESDDWHIALVCYEKPSDFCHRHLISKWLRDNGIECKEWEKTKV